MSISQFMLSPFGVPNLFSNASGVTITPSSHGPTPFPKYFEADADSLLRKTVPGVKYKEIFQSSFDGTDMPSAVQGSENGFVYAAVQAYSDHRHLTLRPEDIWFAILSQLSAYINKHAEELRHLFVAFEGKRKLVVEDDGTRYSVDWGKLAKRFTDEIHKNVVDPDLRDWILPNFSTTSSSDTVVASILMMSTMQKYFDYEARLICGIPTVTLLGKKADYENILGRLDKLDSFGSEPAHFARLLRPILSWFIRSFDNPKDPEVVSFWQRILDEHRQGSGSTVYSGWITAFCFWDQDGNRLTDALGERDQFKRLTLDDTDYPTINSDEIPPGIGTVPVLVIDNGVEIKSQMVAGSVGILSSRKESKSSENPASLHDSVQPGVGWWIYELIEG